MPTHDDIMAVLATIPDPEMPISIVDLGIVEDVRVQSSPRRSVCESPLPVGEGLGEGGRADVARKKSAVESTPSVSCVEGTSAGSTTNNPHPQPLSQRERGAEFHAIGDAGAAITVDITPTFVGCPALDMIRDDITSKLTAMDGVSSVAVNFVTDPPWSVDRITDAGRASLREHGVTTPARCGGTSEPYAPTADAGPGAGLTTLTLSAATAGDDRSIACPFCQSTNTRMESRFGPTRCRMIYYCDGCRNSFEHLKRI